MVDEDKVGEVGCHVPLGAISDVSHVFSVVRLGVDTPVTARTTRNGTRTNVLAHPSAPHPRPSSVRLKPQVQTEKSCSGKLP